MDSGLSPTALAIAFCESRPFMTSTIVGATSMAQVRGRGSPNPNPNPSPNPYPYPYP